MFVIVEGPNGAGKTTLIKGLAAKGYKTLSSPNGTPLAKMLRPACRGTEPWTDIDKRIQFMLFSAARYDEYIRLVHNNPEVIVADRWWTSTYVYQCVLQGIEEDFLKYTIHPEEKIDLVLFLDGDDDVLIKRVQDERAKNPTHGNCRWTQESETMKSLMTIYRNDMPVFLEEGFGVPSERLDTTHINSDEVLKLAIDKINEYNRRSND